ncbi:hypothetical protein TNCV_2785511, partial [Trichonephila clavipes]
GPAEMRVVRTGDDKEKVMETGEEKVYLVSCTGYGIRMLRLVMFSNSILHIVVYGQIDSYDKVFLSLDTLGI